MRYLVTMTCSNPMTAQTDPKAFATVIEKAFLPSIETLTKWEREKRVFGGCTAGTRELAFVIEAGSNEEVGELVSQLPVWAYLNTSVRPLESFDFRLSQGRKLVSEAKRHY